jgi:hypothetical protein
VILKRKYAGRPECWDPGLNAGIQALCMRSCFRVELTHFFVIILAFMAKENSGHLVELKGWI